MEAHACSKLPSKVFILPQPRSITRRNSYLNQPLFPPSQKFYLYLSRCIWMQVFIPVLTKMNDDLAVLLTELSHIYLDLIIIDSPLPLTEQPPF